MVRQEDILIEEEHEVITPGVPEQFQGNNEFTEATGDGYVWRNAQAPAFNKAGRTNVRMQNTEGR